MKKIQNRCCNDINLYKDPILQNLFGDEDLDMCYTNITYDQGFID
jgi:hypothetical protein